MVRPRAEFGKASGREIFGWCMFDFANSSFTTIIVTVIYSVYFTKLVAEGRPDGDFLWSLGIFLSQGIVLMSAPVVGAFADFSGAKKRFLVGTYLTCVLFTALLSTVTTGQVAKGLLFFIVANMAYSMGENFIASFLPELAPPERMGRVSGYGWAWGYMGGLFSLLICYPFLKGGFTPSNAANLRMTSLVTALFFLVSAIPTFVWLKERKSPQTLSEGETSLAVGFSRVAETLRHLRAFKELGKFLVVFLIYSSGINVVVAFASIFAEKQVGFTAVELSFFFLVVQLSSALGAFLFGFVQDRIGAKQTIMLTLIVWIIVTLGAAVSVSKPFFFVIGNLAGVAIGSSQSSARALVGLFSPPEKSAEFFGFWGLFWKLSSALGPLAFGTISSGTGSQRIGILVTAGFFLLGFLGMFFIREREGREAVQAYRSRSQTR